MNFTSQLVPESLRSRRNLYRSAHMILQIDVAIFFMTFPLAIFYYWIEYDAGVWLMIFTNICTILFPIIMNKTNNLELSGHFFLGCSLFVFSVFIGTTGGAYSPYLVWLLCVPPMAVLYMKKKAVYMWLSILIAIAVTIFGADFVGYKFPQMQSANWYTPTKLFSLVMVTWVCTAVVQYFLNGFRRFNRKLRKSNTDLQKSNQELERFAYIASHDLKSPLRNIVSFSSLLERRQGHLIDENGKAYMNIIKDSARQMHSLVEDILEYSKTGNKEKKLQKVSLNEVLLDITTKIQSDPEYVPSEIMFEPMPIIQGDAANFYQLFRNLIENGIKYNKNELPTVRIRMEHRKDFILFVVSDNGIGIDKKYHDTVFEMFKRLHHQNEYSGTGVGLAICKKIIQLYNGNIWIESNPKGGSVFFIQLNSEILVKETKQAEQKLTTNLSTPTQ